MNRSPDSDLVAPFGGGPAAAGYTVAAGARASASVLLLRQLPLPPLASPPWPGQAGVPASGHAPASGALEVLMLRRAERAGDLRSGACVFPGGVLEASDGAAHDCVQGADDLGMSTRLGLTRGGLDYVVAALRECFEECGLLLAVRADGSPFDAASHSAALHPWRARLAAGEATTAQLCDAFGIRLDASGLAYSSHWLTPPGMPKRWDTRFFMAMAPLVQTPSPDYGEAVELMWTTPLRALQPGSGFKLLPAMRDMLTALLRHADAASALADAQARSQRGIALTMPRMAAMRSAKGRAMHILVPDDPAYAEVARLDPHGRGDVSCELVAGVAVRLSPRVLRVTAPNPGLMTGPGTNTYLVGAPDDDVRLVAADAPWTVIDPGPADSAHLQALLAAAGARGIGQILVTHTHMDHSPGAHALACTTGAPVYGRTASHAQGQDPNFSPARELQHGERIAVGEGSTLRVLHTPGHASNHLCFLLEEERTLFTGDHVMQGATVVINPPDGDMTAYLQALRELTAEDLQWLAPGHGFLVAQPRAVLQALLAHRLRRESRVLDALQQLQTATLDGLLPVVYADVPALLHPVARRSLLAHLLKLQSDNLARLRGEYWCSVGAESA